MGFDVGRFLDIVKTVAPMVLMVIPGAAPFAPLVAVGISEAESLAGASGEEKKAHVLKIVRVGVDATNAAKPGSVDPQLVDNAVSPSIDLIVDMSKRLQAIEQAAPVALGPTPAAPSAPA